MTGSLQVKNDKYYAVLNLYDKDGKRKPKWVYTGFNTKDGVRKAEKALRAIITEHEQQHIVATKNVLFSDYVKTWLYGYKSQVDTITWQGYRTNAESHIIPYFTKKKTLLSDLNPKLIQQYYDDKFADGRTDGKGGLSARSVKLHSVVINLALKDATLKNIIAYNPAKRAKVPQQVKQFKGNFYTVQQANTLLEICNDEMIKPILELTLCYGLRRSEVLGLMWDAIDFENNQLIIKRTVVQYDTIVEKNKTKNLSSTRGYPLMEETREILLKVKAKQEQNRALFGKSYTESKYVFTWEDGKLIRPDYLSHKLSKIIKNNNLPYIRFHDLRHSCASILLSKGWTLKDIQEWLGHSNIAMTANIYTHVDTSRKQELANDIGSILSK